MLFAHGPVGFLFAQPLRRFFREKKYLFIAFFFGIFPDIDVIFYYFFKAETSHRDYPTHSLLPYIFLALVVAFFSRRFAFAFFLGAVSHLVGDSLSFGVKWLWPFSQKMYALTDISAIAPFIDQYGWVMNYTLEGMAFIAFFIILFQWKYPGNRNIYFLFVLMPFLVWGLLFIQSHQIRASVLDYTGNRDADEMINMVDDDADGDGKKNFYDIDADGDGVSNRDEILFVAREFHKVWYDISENGFLEIPARLGFINNERSIRLALENAGLFYRPAFREDYLEHLQNYEEIPGKNSFYTSASNLLAFARSQNFSVKNPELGDIIFWNKAGKIQMAIVTQKEEEKIWIAEVASDFQGEREFGTRDVLLIGRFW